MARGAKNSGRHTELFLDMLAAERGAGKNTLDAYSRDLADLEGFLSAEGKQVASASTDDIRGYLTDLARRGLAATSVARKLSAVRQLYRFLYAEGHRGDDPAAVIEGPKRGRALPKVLSVKHVDGLLTQAREGMKAEAPAVRRLNMFQSAGMPMPIFSTG